MQPSLAQVSALRLRWEESWDQGVDLSAEELCSDCPTLLDAVKPLIEDLRAVKCRRTGPDSAGGVPETLASQEREPAPPADIADTRDTYATRATPDAESMQLADLARAEGLPPVPGYEILGELGRGGMGVVYKARQVALRRVVALKMILGAAGDEERRRFKGETEAVARLHHPHIVQIYEVGEWRAGGTGPAQPYCALEFIDGGSLDRLIRGTPQSPHDSAELVRTLAQAVQAAHEKHVIHRDLKPPNVLMARRSPAAGPPEHSPPRLTDFTPKVADFGLAKRLDDQVGQTQTGSVMGSPPYMAPEQAEGRLDDIGPWTDVYALGAVLYELLTGRPPFKGRTVWETLEQVLRQEPVPPRHLQPSVPPCLETICLKALSKQPQSRYLSARDLADDLGRYLGGRPVLARPVGRVTRLLKWVRRSPVQAAALLAAVVFACMGVALLYLRMDSARNQAELKQRELDEGQRLAEAGDRVANLYAQASRSAEDDRWPQAGKAAGAALEVLANEPGLEGHPLRERLEDLHRRAEARDAEERLGQAERKKLARLQQHHADAAFFATPFTGLELAENFERIRRAASEGLSLFAVAADGRPRTDRRFFTASEARGITEMCCELLWLESDTLAHVRPQETVEAVKGRLAKALALLDRADGLGLGQTYSGLARRAVCLERMGRQEEAAVARKRAEDVLPELAADFFLRGLEHYRREEFDRAAPLVAAALKRRPGHFGAEYLLAACRVAEKRYQDARDGLTRCLEARPDFPWPRLLLGFAEMELNNPRAALAEYNAVLKPGVALDPMVRYVAHVNRGVLAVKQRRWDDAAADFDRAIALNADATAARLNLAVMHRQRADLGWREPVLYLGAGGVNIAALGAWKRDAWQTAVKVLDDAVARRSDVAALYQERSQLHLRLGDADRARADLARAVALAPTAGPRLATDLFELARLLHDGREYRQAEVVLGALLEIRPGHALAWRLKAQALLAQDRYQEAGQALDEYLKRTPDRVSPRTTEQVRRLSQGYLARGLLHERLKDYRAAADSYTRGLEAERDAELLSRRGWSHLALGGPRLAQADFDEVLGQRKDDPDALLGRAEALARLGEWRKALDDAEQALTRGVRTSRALYAAARVYAQAHTRLAVEPPSPARDRFADRTRERAVQMLQRALTLVPPQERREFWREYVERDPAMRSLAGEYRWGGE